ncbi:hypothetical protein BASA81_005824 [Batrachochytrium salamandrivorans]|nr:hypothetical protein BASA81_005824 [Batrachochytrium salamandrivorans]
MESLCRVEDELVLLLGDAEKLMRALRDIPEQEKAAQEAMTSLFSRLAKVQAGISENIDHLKDYVPFERHAGGSRIKMRQARSDRLAAKSSLEIVLEQFTAGLGSEQEEEDEEEDTYPDKGIKRMRRDF